MPWTGGLTHLGEYRPVADLEDGKLSERQGWLQRFPVFRPDTHILEGDGTGVRSAKTDADAFGDPAQEERLNRMLAEMVPRCGPRTRHGKWHAPVDVKVGELDALEGNRGGHCGHKVKRRSLGTDFWGERESFPHH